MEQSTTKTRPKVTCFICGRPAINWARFEIRETGRTSMLYVHKHVNANDTDMCEVSVDTATIAKAPTAKSTT